MARIGTIGVARLARMCEFGIRLMHNVEVPRSFVPCSLCTLCCFTWRVPALHNDRCVGCNNKVTIAEAGGRLAPSDVSAHKGAASSGTETSARPASGGITSTSD